MGPDFLARRRWKRFAELLEEANDPAGAGGRHRRGDDELHRLVDLTRALAAAQPAGVPGPATPDAYFAARLRARLLAQAEFASAHDAAPTPPTPIPPTPIPPTPIPPAPSPSTPSAAGPTVPAPTAPTSAAPTSAAPTSAAPAPPRPARVQPRRAAVGGVRGRRAVV